MPDAWTGLYHGYYRGEERNEDYEAEGKKGH